jgi:hypothetical protein
MRDVKMGIANYVNLFIDFLVWCPGQNKRIAPLSFLHGCRKRRLKINSTFTLDKLQ